MKDILQGFIAPQSIAIIGASEDTGKPGGKIVENLISRGYQGELILINPKSASVQGRPALPSLAGLDSPPDLAYIAIPSRFVAGALEELAGLGCRRVIVLSAGFGEVGQEGRAEEERLAAIADRHGITLLGPNCLGVMSPVHAGKFAGLLPRMKPGGVDFISGSGATVDVLAEQAVRRGLAFHSFFTVGNSAQTGVTDILGLFDQGFGPESSKHLMLYLEKLGSPGELLDHARSLARKGCLIAAIKSGTTEDGSRAAASHTGALAEPDTAVQALFDKAGLIRVESKLDMVDVVTALTLAKGRYDGRRACVITDAGGPGVMTTDELNRRGISTPLLKEETRRKLAELLPPGAGVKNPVDMMPGRTPEQTAKVLEIIARDEAGSIDYILIQIAAPGFSDNGPVYQVIAEAMDNLETPVFPSFATSISSARALEEFRGLGKCHFEDEVSMARAVGRMVNRPRIFEPGPDPAGYDGAEAAAALEGITGQAPPEAVRSVLRAAGIPLPREELIREPRDLEGLERRVPGPWVMKVAGPLHKTELDGVALDVAPDRAGATFDRLMKIAGAEGVLVQESVTGPEVLMGLSREGEFGHLVAFGLGGVLAEALADVKFALGPLSPQEAGGLIRSVKALALLQGFRGRPGQDLDRLADILTRVSLLGRDIPGLKEMDINPLKGIGADLAAVDVRMILD